ncbi:UNVERIFIED_CONTAM: hypothetical protein Sradi_0431200 [Sesamum radiatum]|uniref:Uncharacterized protein n=1 Tax=Sesamum radiatum TaxID=300843 RepID=A0AAW2W6D6_SESRA
MAQTGVSRAAFVAVIFVVLCLIATAVRAQDSTFAPAPAPGPDAGAGASVSCSGAVICFTVLLSFAAVFRQ